jgi:hypothetical protein
VPKELHSELLYKNRTCDSSTNLCHAIIYYPLTNFAENLCNLQNFLALDLKYLLQCILNNLNKKQVRTMIMRFLFSDVHQNVVDQRSLGSA